MTIFPAALSVITIALPCIVTFQLTNDSKYAINYYNKPGK